MDPWERGLIRALRDVPDWPGDPERLWRRIEPRLRQPLWRRPAFRAALGGGAAAACGAILLVSVWAAAADRFRPVAAGGVPGPAVSADLRSGLEARTELLAAPAAGRPVRFAVVLGTRDGRPVRVSGGELEVRNSAGELVWHTALPELAVGEVRGPQAVRAVAVWPQGPAEPGHYRAEVSLRPGAPGGDGIGLGLTQFFVPFPAGSRLVGNVPVRQAETRAGITAVLEHLSLTPDFTRLRFSLEGDALAGSFQWTIRGPDGVDSHTLHSEYRRRGRRLDGIADFEPTPATARRLTIRLHRVGVRSPVASETVELPHTWEWEVNLDGVTGV